MFIVFFILCCFVYSYRVKMCWMFCYFVSFYIFIVIRCVYCFSCCSFFIFYCVNVCWVFVYVDLFVYVDRVSLFVVFFLICFSLFLMVLSCVYCFFLLFHRMDGPGCGCDLIYVVRVKVCLLCFILIYFIYFYRVKVCLLFVPIVFQFIYL